MFRLLPITMFSISMLFASAVMANDFKLTSTDITLGGKLSEKHVFKGFGCKGENISPALKWSGAPKGTKSFVVTAYDPDAPTGSGWWHWVAMNIPAKVNSLPTNAGSGKGMPEGVIQLKSDYGTTGFGGACPPPGRLHRYIFTVYALKVDKLPAGKNSSAALVGFMTKSNALAKATLTAVYHR